MANNKDTKLQVFHRPNWHPQLSALFGELKGQYGYVTEVGTIELLGPLYEDPEISQYQTESEFSGPILLISAKSGSTL